MVGGGKRVKEASRSAGTLGADMQCWSLINVLNLNSII